MIHTNSLLAYQQLDKKTRCHVIYRVIELWGELTDRQVAEKLGFSDLNACRPRITELVQQRYLKEVGVVKDHVTGRTVRKLKTMSKAEREAGQGELF